MQNNSILKQYYAIFMSVLLTSIAVLGAVFLLLASRYFKDDQFSRLEIPATRAVAATQSEILLNDFKYNKTMLHTVYMYLTSGTEQTDIFWVDLSGSILVCSDQDTCTHQTHIVPSDLLKKANSSIDGYKGVGNIGDMYKKARYIKILPVVTEKGEITSYIVATATTQALTDFLINVLQMLGIATLVVIFIASAVIYATTNRLVAPLRVMAENAKNFGQGDFAHTIAVTSDDEIGQLGTALNNMATSLSVLENTRRSFVANVSHELKTPMTTIGGFVDGILDGTIPPEKQNYYLQIVSDEVKRLSRLVTGMLNVSKIEEGKMSLTPVSFDMLDTVFSTLLSFERQISEKRLEIEGLDCDKVWVEGDVDLIHQVVYNLVDNAIKFVNVGGKLSFSFEVSQGMTYVSVLNTGDGIPKEQLQMVFERFYKADRSRGLNKKGVGLGLYIVRTIVNRHGGEISVSSKEGEYTEFRFSLPTSKNKSARSKRT